MEREVLKHWQLLTETYSEVNAVTVNTERSGELATRFLSLFITVFLSTPEEAVLG